jgi:hypothetical protein
MLGARTVRFPFPNQQRNCRLVLPTPGGSPYGRRTEAAIRQWLLSVRADARRKPGKRPPILRRRDQLAHVTGFIRSSRASEPWPGWDE